MTLGFPPFCALLALTLGIGLRAADFNQTEDNDPADSPELAAEQHAWEAEMSKPIDWQPLEVTSFKVDGGAKLEKLADGSISATGRSAYADTFTLHTRTPMRGITAFRLEVLPQPGAKGQAALSELRVSTYLSGAEVNVPLKQPSTDLSGEIMRAIDNNNETHWTFVLPTVGTHAAVFQTTKAIGQEEATRLMFTVIQNHGEQGTLARFRFSATNQAPPIRQLPESIGAIIAIEPSERSEAQRIEIANYFRRLNIRSLTNDSSDRATKAK